MVEASEHTYDDFEFAVVYADSADDAVAVVMAEIEKDPLSQAPGRWEPLADGASLQAKVIPVKRGAVLGHAHPC